MYTSKFSILDMSLHSLPFWIVPLTASNTAAIHRPSIRVFELYLRCAHTHVPTLYPLLPSFPGILPLEFPQSNQYLLQL